MKPSARILSVVTALLFTALIAGGLLRTSASESATTRTHTVIIEQMKFSPAELRIHSGDRVVFENKDLFPHTATASEPKAFDSGLIEAGESWTTRVVRRSPTIRYTCLYHPTMEGRIIVNH